VQDLSYLCRAEIDVSSTSSGEHQRTGDS